MNTVPPIFLQLQVNQFHLPDVSSVASTTVHQCPGTTWQRRRSTCYRRPLGSHLAPFFPAYCVEGWPNPATFDNFQKSNKTFKENCQMETWRRNNDCIKNHARIGPISYENATFSPLWYLNLFVCAHWQNSLSTSKVQYMYLHICTYIMLKYIMLILTWISIMYNYIYILSNYTERKKPWYYIALGDFGKVWKTHTQFLN